MKVLIVEDEKPALDNLVECIRNTDSSIVIAGTAARVSETVKWLKTNPSPDLVLMDIELSDGICFNIFTECQVTCPVIFTTAYTKYLTQAFDYNSIDYLLKPIDLEKLSTTLRKYKNLQRHFIHNYSFLNNDLVDAKKSKSRIVVKKGTEFQTLKKEDIAYFFTEHKLVFAVDKDSKKYLCEISSLGEVEEMVDEKVFFRVNRKYIVNANYIVKFRSVDKSKIGLDLLVPAAEKIIISQENAPLFKKWINEI
jgi:DNA-binding LytR/AlgR family response regulator